MAIERFRIVNSAPGVEPERVRAAVEAPPTVVLKRDGDTGVWAVKLQDAMLVVKRWRLTRPKRRIQAAINATPACRHRRGARLLADAGIPTAPCRAIVRGRIDGEPHEWLIMDLLPGKTVLEHLAAGELGVRQEHRLAEAVGEQVGRLAGRPWANRDHKPSNLVVLGEIESGVRPRVAVIDCVGVGRRASAAWMAKTLLAECFGTQVPLRRALMMRCVSALVERLGAPGDPRGLDPPARRALRRTIWRGAARTIARHGDPTPRVDPLDRHQST